MVASSGPASQFSVLFQWELISFHWKIQLIPIPGIHIFDYWGDWLTSTCCGEGCDNVKRLLNQGMNAI